MFQLPVLSNYIYISLTIKTSFWEFINHKLHFSSCNDTQIAQKVIFAWQSKIYLILFWFKSCPDVLHSFHRVIITTKGEIWLEAIKKCFDISYLPLTSDRGKRFSLGLVGKLAEEKEEEEEEGEEEGCFAWLFFVECYCRLKNDSEKGRKTRSSVLECVAPVFSASRFAALFAFESRREKEFRSHKF